MVTPDPDEVKRPHIDWDPRAAAVMADQIAAYDAQRARGPVARSGHGVWAVLGHAEVCRVLDEPAIFSNAVSTHVAVPNGMDPPEHTRYRAIVDRYFTPERMRSFEPAARRIVADLVAGLNRRAPVDVMEAFAEPLANQLQCAFMGWPTSLHEPLREWTHRNHRATRAQDREAMSAVALEFDGYIREQLAVRRAAGADAPADVTTALLAETIDGEPLADADIVSIVRNWTVGELSTIAASVGIMLEFLAAHPDVQEVLRTGAGDAGLLARASDEMLRIHGPLIANRRRTTCPVQLAGRSLPAEARVVVVWAAANRDESVFGDPDRFDPDRDPAANLLYGAGIHVCPGAPLARLELRVVLEELFAATTSIEPAPGLAPIRATYPASGYEHLPLVVR